MAPSVYMSLNEKPRVVLDVMHRVESEALQTNKSWNWGCATALILLALSAPFLLLDVVLGYNLSTFSLVAVLLWGLAIALIVYILITGRAKLEKAKFKAAWTIILNLRDDVAKKSRVTGWLDLTGPRQESKLARTGYSSSGKRKLYYQDTWLQFKTGLADGNVLRLALTEQQKVKGGIVADHRMKLKGRIVFDPKTFQMRPFTADEKRDALLPDTMVNLAEGVIEVTGSLSPKDPDPWQVLNLLKAVYEHLEPVGQQSYINSTSPTTPLPASESPSPEAPV